MTPLFEGSFKYKFAAMNPMFIKDRARRWNGELSCDSLGWCSCDSAKTDDFESHAKGTIFVQTYDKSPNINNNINYISKIVELCDERNIRVVAVTTPTWCSYYDNIDAEQYNEMLQIMEDMQRKYKIEYYNFIKDSRFGKDDFANSDHLLRKGAEKFTKILADTLAL